MERSSLFFGAPHIYALTQNTLKITVLLGVVSCWYVLLVSRWCLVCVWWCPVCVGVCGGSVWVCGVRGMARSELPCVDSKRLRVCRQNAGVNQHEHTRTLPTIEHKRPQPSL